MLRLVQDGIDRVDDIAAELGVSGATVRRDLAALAEAGLLARTYGGAQTGPTFTELALGERTGMQTRAKAAIAQAAADLVPTGAGTVFLDAGSTCAQLAEHLRQRDDLTIVTRGLEIAVLLATPGGPRVVVLEGEVATMSHGIVGPSVSEGLARFRFDVAFLGADAVNPLDGVGEPTLEEALTKEVAAARAARVVVLADATKVGRQGVPVWATLPPSWILITDVDPTGDGEDTADVAGFEAAGVEVIRVRADAS